MINLYVDMDGVVSKFDEGFANYKPQNKEWCSEAFSNFILDSGFEKLQGYDINKRLSEEFVRLSSKGITIKFLSSCGNALGASIIYEQKRKWLDKNGFKHYDLICVKHKGLKKHFASATSILLDDTQQNVWDWRERGGRALRIDSSVGVTQFDIIEVLLFRRKIAEMQVYGGDIND